MQRTAKSGEKLTINWEIFDGEFLYNDTVYYIDRYTAIELREIFTKYCPYQDGPVL